MKTGLFFSCIHPHPGGRTHNVPHVFRFKFDHPHADGKNFITILVWNHHIASRCYNGEATDGRKTAWHVPEPAGGKVVVKVVVES